MALETTIDDLGIDLLQNMVSRLPALSFASADCVSRLWNHVCGRVLCRPKLSSACSFNPSLRGAIEEVVNKVLSDPIRPQFAIASFGPAFDLEEALQLITATLDSKFPVIISCSYGIIGRDAISDEFKDNLWGGDDEVGAMLTVGSVPGVKVKSISLLRQHEVPRTFMIDQFVTNIREFSTSISGHQSPAAIMIFGAFQADMDAVMRKMDYAMSPETVIVGDCGFGFPRTATEGLADVVALVFVMDRNQTPGIGETKFHAVLSSGLSPVGATYTVVDVVRENRGDYTTRLVGRKEESFETIDEDEFPTVYIGVTKTRICSIGQEEAKWMTSLAFHRVLPREEDDESFCVKDVGINIGDIYRRYHLNSNTAGSCVDNVSNLLRSFKQRSTNVSDKWEVCGGFLFTCVCRDVALNEQANVDNSVFLENFPGVTFGGTMCLKPIGRGYLIPQESQEQKSGRACLHPFSAVYLIISYAP